MTDEVLVEHEDGLVIVTINRPEQRNAVNRAVSYAVCAAIDEMDRNPALRVGILTGAGGHFCAGMDLKAFLRGEVTRVEGRGILGIARTPPLKPLIAASLGVRSKGYQPDRQKFTIQDRPDSALLDIELKNTSDANFLLRNAGPLRLYNEAEVLSVPPHTTLRVTVMALSRSREVELKFEVLNAVTAPGKHPMVSYRIPTD